MGSPRKRDDNLKRFQAKYPGQCSSCGGTIRRADWVAAMPIAKPTKEDPNAVAPKGKVICISCFPIKEEKTTFPDPYTTPTVGAGSAYQSPFKPVITTIDAGSIHIGDFPPATSMGTYTSTDTIYVGDPYTVKPYPGGQSFAVSMPATTSVNEGWYAKEGDSGYWLPYLQLDGVTIGGGVAFPTRESCEAFLYSKVLGQEMR